MKERQIGDLRLWWSTNGVSKNYDVGSLADAFMMINAIASVELDDESVSWNAHGIMVYVFDEDNGWHFEDLYNGLGESIEDLFNDIENSYELSRDEFVKVIKESEYFNFDYIDGGTVKLY